MVPSVRKKVFEWPTEEQIVVAKGSRRTKRSYCPDRYYLDNISEPDSSDHDHQVEVFSCSFRQGYDYVDRNILQRLFRWVTFSKQFRNIVSHALFNSTYEVLVVLTQLYDQN